MAHQSEGARTPIRSLADLAKLPGIRVLTAVPEAKPPLLKVEGVKPPTLSKPAPIGSNSGDGQRKENVLPRVAYMNDVTRITNVFITGRDRRNGDNRASPGFFPSSKIREYGHSTVGAFMKNAREIIPLAGGVPEEPLSPHEERVLASGSFIVVSANKKLVRLPTLKGKHLEEFYAVIRDVPRDSSGKDGLSIKEFQKEPFTINALRKMVRAGYLDLKVYGSVKGEQ